MSIDVELIIKEWWDAYQADPRASYDNIVSGMRKGQSTDDGVVKYPGGVQQPITKAQRQTGSCQYFINGLSAPCSNWNHETLLCEFEFENVDERPTGYGVGKCDMLGRRSWCTQYVPSKSDDLTEFVCIAPCMERSGLGKQITTVSGSLSFRPVLPSEVQGYNADEDGVGRCDGWGLGRGDQKDSYGSIEELYQDPRMCRYYRPHQMGFGAIQPHPYHGSDYPGLPFDAKVNTIPETLEGLHDGSNADPLVLMPKRVPFIFQVYNARALYQKCAHWKNSTPSFFVMSDDADPTVQTIELDEAIYCEYAESAVENPATPYYSYEEDWPAGIPWVLVNTIAKYGGVVCNGAKPECPCYTGKWSYCTDNNMRDGMRITADQIFELRFWTSIWSTQDEYDAYYLQKPGRTYDDYADESTSAIYTFTQWQKLDVSDPNESVMLGYRHSMCMPAPLNKREFSSTDYITKLKLEYPKVGNYTGTNVVGEKVYYPSLVRQLEDPDFFTPDINITYPYFTTDPWATTVCQQEEVVDFCIHNFNSMTDPTISFVGHTAAECDLYIINASLLEDSAEVVKAKEYLDNYVRANQIALVGDDIWYDYNDKIDKFLDYCYEQEEGYTSTQTGEYGLFNESSVKLKPNSLNEFYVVCRYSSSPFSEYVFRKVKVLSVYWGALITQDTMTHTHYSPTQFNSFPIQLNPGANITGKVDITKGNIFKVVPLYYHYIRGLISNKAYYGYCINEYEVTEDNALYWTQIGSTGYVWTELDNIELSYLWNFEIVEAYLEVIPEEDDDGNLTRNMSVNLCGEADETQIEGIQVPLTHVYTPRKEVPPNAVLLKAERPMGFFKSDWKLVVKYKYQLLEQAKATESNTTVVWPANLDVDHSFNKFRSSPYTVDHVTEDSTFTISNVGTSTSRATLAVMALITDEYGRVQTATATKMLLQGYKQGNRNVEIEYAYAADSKSYQLEPLSGFATWVGAPKAIAAGDSGLHFRNALCGDHSCDQNNCIGPMWYPFDNCTPFAFYDVYTPAAQCYLFINEGEEEIEKIGDAAWRYGVADEYNAWVTEGGNWAATCGASWHYYYSRADMSGMQWAGSARKVAVIDTSHYDFMGWSLPPFSNAGRAYIDRFLSKDFFSFLDFSGNIPSTSEEYMPMVFTDEDLVTELNCFSGNVYTGGSINYFSMLSNYTAGFTNEVMSTTRHRLEDVVQPVLTRNCSYPNNMIQTEDGTYVIRYGFKNENYVWAWPEYWQPIERTIEGSTHGKFNFLTLARPSYFFDAMKREHRLISDEGEYTIIFQPPQEGDAGSEDDSSGKYPSISINGAYPRYFNIIYDSYDSEGYAEWRDESDNGEIGSSGGGGIYELANNGNGLNAFEFTYDIQWVHDFNTVFDDTALEDPDTDRMVYLGYSTLYQKDKFGYFNRGLVVNIPINKLKLLPIEIYDAANPTAVEETNYQYIGFWLLGGEYGVAPIEINIDGYYGTDENVDGTVDVYGRPSVRVAESEDDPVFSGGSSVPDWPTGAGTSVGYLEYIDGDTIPELESYKIRFELDRTPDRLTQNLQYFMIKLGVVAGNELFIKSFEVKLGKYTYAEERVKVWERKYHVGEAILSTNNADGPDTMIYRTMDRDGKNSGQYFPMNVSSGRGFDGFGVSVQGYDNNGIPEGGNGTFVITNPAAAGSSVTDPLKEATSTISKLNMTECAEFYESPEPIEDITLDNLKDKERDIQKELFEEATAFDSYDELDFSGVTHPALTGWFDYIGGGFSVPGPMKLQYNKVLWENSRYPAWLKQDADFWQPGGHYFAWSTKIMKTKCYILGPIQTVYEAEWVHHRHGGKEEVMDAGHAYAGWGRVAYQEAKIWTNQILGLDDQSSEPDLLTGARNGVM